MGFGDVIGEGGQQHNSYRHYADHEADDKLQEMFDHAEENVFPEEIQCEFIEVSRRMEKIGSTTYHKTDNGEDVYFIRVSERAVEELEDWQLYRLMKSSMLHIWCMQRGHGDISQNSSEYKWLCGVIGATVPSGDDKSDQWKRLCEPFMEQKDTRWERDVDIPEVEEEPEDDQDGSVPPPEEDII